MESNGGQGCVASMKGPDLIHPPGFYPRDGEGCRAERRLFEIPLQRDIDDGRKANLRLLLPIPSLNDKDAAEIAHRLGELIVVGRGSRPFEFQVENDGGGAPGPELLDEFSMLRTGPLPGLGRKVQLIRRPLIDGDDDYVRRRLDRSAHFEQPWQAYGLLHGSSHGTERQDREDDSQTNAEGQSPCRASVSHVAPFSGAYRGEASRRSHPCLP